MPTNVTDSGVNVTDSGEQVVETYPLNLPLTPGVRDYPQRLRVWAAFGQGNEIEDISNRPDVWIPLDTLKISRSNENGASASASFEVVFPNSAYAEFPPLRYIGIDDPTEDNGLGGALGYFAGYSIQSEPGQEPGEERTLNMTVGDYNLLSHHPPRQITVQWPPGDGTPVVNTTVDTSISAGNDVVITPASLRHLYVGKQVWAENSDGSNRERITVKTINYVAGTFTADFTTSKTSTDTNVPLSLHYVGLREIVPESMTNINVGSLVYCKKNHGVQTQGNEWVVVTAVTATSFFAYFIAWKAHDWTVRSYWRLVGGISDKELIADGWQQHIDVLDPVTGIVTQSLIAVESLIDYCFTNADVPIEVDKTGVDEVIVSLPHGKWEGSTPAQVLDWVVSQNTDVTKKPRWHFDFLQPLNFTGSIMVPRLRYYDSLSPSLLADVGLTDALVIPDEEAQARYSGYSRPEDGNNFANRLTVMGANYSIGAWTDLDSIEDPLAYNYVGRLVEAPVVIDNNLTTNEECELRAAELAKELGLSTRKRTLRLQTAARLDPYILYEPRAVTFAATFEAGTPDDFEARSVTLSFDERGLPSWDFVLGDPVPIRAIGIGTPKRIHRATVITDGSGQVRSAANPTTAYITTHAFLDQKVDLYVADPSEGDFTLRLPQAGLSPGLPVTIKVPDGAVGIVTVQAYGDDTIDGSPTKTLTGGQALMLQSAGEYDERLVGGNWHGVNVGSGGATAHPLAVQRDVAVPSDGMLTTVTSPPIVLQSWILSAVVEGGPPNNLTVDVLVNGVSICGGSPPSLSNQSSGTGACTGWTTTFAATTTFQLSVTAYSANVTYAQLVLIGDTN